VPLQLLVYDDNEFLRNSIKTLMQWNNEFDVCGTFADSRNILEEVETLKPNVIVMDIDMPPSNGIETVALLRKHGISVPVIMLTVFDDDDNIVNAIGAGANGYLLKKDIEHIPASIKDVLQGGAPMTSVVAKKVLTAFSNKLFPKNATLAELTSRETEILNLLVKGNSQKMISHSLQLSIDTVRTHLKNIYKKLHVNSATEAVYKATH
jgi:DNA-binding NarL/FixJ family response regulator